MSKKQLKDYEIESALDDIFGFPSDPDQSEDAEESDEEINIYNTTKLQRILEDLDKPGLRSTDIIRASPQPSTSSDEPGLGSIETIRAPLSPQPSTSSADLPSSNCCGIGQTT
ncbi:unnamed protein product [Arctia plantaginis]|uniref:Uncharacterized protein n=1 Tax=Arctia plantaginis TaxID=874455 RepID=A0A8S0Z7U6_ARCPL|nr:unnamed protein product [Arctia plantaginis]CAB3228375.1 unnamed protein product [Arctia plantaginis]